MLMPGCRSRSQRGAALVEFALIAPLFFLIVFGLVEFAIVFAGYSAQLTPARKEFVTPLCMAWTPPAA